MIQKPTFVPVLNISSGITEISFYAQAFDAMELWRINNPDGTVHVAAFSIDGAMFRLHEEGQRNGHLSPAKTGGTTATIALVVDDVHAVVARAIEAGAVLLSPVTDYEYGYRQAEIKDPFGHHWLIEKLINKDDLDKFLQ